MKKHVKRNRINNQSKSSLDSQTEPTFEYGALWPDLTRYSGTFDQHSNQGPARKEEIQNSKPKSLQTQKGPARPKRRPNIQDVIVEPYTAKHARAGSLIMTIDLGGMNWSLLAAIPGYSKWVDRQLMFRPTAANVAYILHHWPDTIWKGSAKKSVEEYQVEAKRSKDIQKRKRESYTGTDDFPYKTQPYEKQREAFLLSRDEHVFALLMEQRTGKTKVALDTAAYLYREGKIDALVIVTINGVHLNWVLDEVPLHLPDWCKHSCYIHKPNNTQKQERSFQEVYRFKGGLKIFSFNFEAFSAGTKLSRDRFELCLDNLRCLLVIDESTKIRTHSSNRTKYLIKQGAKALYRRILTGAAVTKGVENLYPQFKFLDTAILGHDTFTSFRNDFCVVINTPISEGSSIKFSRIVGYKNLDRLQTGIDGCSFRALLSECVDVPPKVYQRHYVELSPRQRRIYNELRDEYITELEGDELSEIHVLTRLMRLQQITSGWFPSDDGKFKAIDKVNPRMKALKEVLEVTEGKVLIFARFVADLDAIVEVLGEKAVAYYGKISATEKRIGKERFWNDNSIEYMIANPQSMAWGHNFACADTAIYYSNFYDLELRIQSEDRMLVDPTGRDRPEHLGCIDFVAPNTLDVKILSSLRTKKNLAELVLQDPRSFFLETE